MNTYVIAYLIGFIRHYVEIEADSAQEAVDSFRRDSAAPIVYCLAPVEEVWE